MTTYNPDAWVVLRISVPGEPVLHKVLAGWYGGWANSNSWRMNSGVERVERHAGGYAIHGYSGSVYLVKEDEQRLTMLMAGVLAELQEKIGEEIVQVVDISEIYAKGGEHDRNH